MVTRQALLYGHQDRGSVLSYCKDSIALYIQSRAQVLWSLHSLRSFIDLVGATVRLFKPPCFHALALWARGRP